jgi:hypothetical protein
MKTHVAENEEKTRRAVVHGRKVWFYRRKPKRERYCSPLPVWHDCYADHEQAVAAADQWANQAKLVRPRRKASGATQTVERAEAVV